MSVFNHLKFTSIFLLLASVSFFTQAHQIRMSVYVEGNNLEGEIYYVGGGNPPGAGAHVELKKGDTIIATTIADKEGLFLFQSVKADTYNVRADGSQGHVAYAEVKKSEFPDFEQSTATTTEINDQVQTNNKQVCASLTPQELHKIIAKAIRPLREKIDHYEAKTRMHDILGGIGYIFGVFGLLVLFRNRKK